jgi:hypothetical protein
MRAPRAKASNAIPVLAVMSLLAGLQCATQFFAHEFHQSVLGTHMRGTSRPANFELGTSVEEIYEHVMNSENSETNRAIIKKCGNRK